MLDINIDFTITGVPDRATADRIASDIRAMLNEKHGTDILIEWEDITDVDTQDFEHMYRVTLDTLHEHYVFEVEASSEKSAEIQGKVLAFGDESPTICDVRVERLD